MQSCDTAFGTVQLERYPATRNPTLQPFDAADLYLLQEASELAANAGPVLVVNDQFGALAVALAQGGRKVFSWSDSHLAEKALRGNLRRNGLDDTAVSFIDSQSRPPTALGLVLLRLPKSMSLLHSQLGLLANVLDVDTPILSGAMIKHLPPNAGDLIEQLVGPYQASLAWKKARLLRTKAAGARAELAEPATTRYLLEGTAIELENLPGVFSRERLDIGTRALLPAIPTNLGQSQVVDLGCGNGALGIQAALNNPDALVTFIDESYAAVASARMNFERAYPGRSANFIVADGLADSLQQQADLILCNPPFHQQQVVGDEIAVGMFEQSHAALRSGGDLMVVGNRHLGYHVKLKYIFGNVNQTAATPKFVVLKATRP